MQTRKHFSNWCFFWAKEVNKFYCISIIDNAFLYWNKITANFSLASDNFLFAMHMAGVERCGFDGVVRKCCVLLMQFRKTPIFVLFFHWTWFFLRTKCQQTNFTMHPTTLKTLRFAMHTPCTYRKSFCHLLYPSSKI